MGEFCFWACGAYVGDPPEEHGIYCPYHRPRPLPEGTWRDKDGFHYEAPNLSKKPPMTKHNEGDEMKDYVTRNAREAPAAGFVRILRDYWWVCLKGDPDALLFYQPKRGAKFGYAQCNKDKSLAASLAPKNTDVVFVPLAFVPVDLRDYDV